MVHKAINNRPNSFEDCVSWARFIFQDYFHNTIAQLLHNFPPEQVNSLSINNFLTLITVLFWTPDLPIGVLQIQDCLHVPTC